MPRLSVVKAFHGAAQAVDRKVGWHRLPKPLAILALVGIRDQLREKNLFDTNTVEGGNGLSALLPWLRR